MSRFTDWTKDLAAGVASVAREALVEGFQDLQPTLAAGQADAQHLLTRMTMDGPSLAGEATVAGAPGTLLQQDAAAAIHHDAGHWQETAQMAGVELARPEASAVATGYDAWLAEQAVERQPPQQQMQME